MIRTFKPKFTITNRITAGLTRIERARGFLEAATLSEAWVKDMGRRALILAAHHTTHIEGTRLTLDQAEQLLEGKPVPEADLWWIMCNDDIFLPMEPAPGSLLRIPSIGHAVMELLV